MFDSFWPSYKKFESSLGLSLVSKIKGDMFQAQARKYPNSLQFALAGAKLPEAIYRTLIAEVNAGLPQFHRYLEVRRRLLKLPAIRYYDIYPPLVSLDRRFTLDEMRMLTMAAIRSLGAENGAIFAKASAAKWMDPFPRPGKASGAYMAGSAYDVHPYLLLNLSDRYDGLTTYAHEWGHAMHSLLANSLMKPPTIPSSPPSVLKGGAAERDRYLGVLKAGGSDYPAAILAKASLDLATPAPYRALVAEFSRTLDQAEALI